MDRVMIDRHNEVVTDGDYWLCLGDFTFYGSKKGTEILSEMRGAHKVCLVGNHDKGANKLANMGFDEVYKHLVLYRDDIWSHGNNSSFLLCTHRPVTWVGPWQMSVAVENWDYYPVPLPTPRGWLNIHGHQHRSHIVRGI
jgi:calcineurin-like phosphoesterase family protein